MRMTSETLSKAKIHGIYCPSPSWEAGKWNKFAFAHLVFVPSIIKWPCLFDRLFQYFPGIWNKVSQSSTPSFSFPPSFKGSHPICPSWLSQFDSSSIKSSGQLTTHGPEVSLARSFGIWGWSIAANLRIINFCMNSFPSPFLVTSNYLTPLLLLVFSLSTHMQLVFWRSRN